MDTGMDTGTEFQLPPIDQRTETLWGIRDVIFEWDDNDPDFPAAYWRVDTSSDVLSVTVHMSDQPDSGASEAYVLDNQNGFFDLTVVYGPHDDGIRGMPPDGMVHADYDGVGTTRYCIRWVDVGGSGCFSTVADCEDVPAPY